MNVQALLAIGLAFNAVGLLGAIMTMFLASSMRWLLFGFVLAAWNVGMIITALVTPS